MNCFIDKALVFERSKAWGNKVDKLWKKKKKNQKLRIWFEELYMRKIFKYSFGISYR